MLFPLFVWAKSASNSDAATAAIFAHQVYDNQEANIQMMNVGTDHSCNVWNRQTSFFDDETNTYAEAWSNSNKMLITFRGTLKSSLKNLLLDLEFSEANCEIESKCGMIHGGFLKSYNKLRGNLTDFVSNSTAEELLITGHSLGGALGTLLALEIHDRFRDRVSLVTFGSPKVGNLEFVSSFKRLQIPHTRFVNVQPGYMGLNHPIMDLIPRYPPGEFRHVIQQTNLTYPEVVNALQLHSVERYKRETLTMISPLTC